MANNMNNYLESQLIQHLFRTSTFAKPTAIYVGLSTGTPGDTSTGSSVNEVSGGSYARVSVPPLNANWDDVVSNNGTTANTAAITFTTASADWGTVSGVFLADASSAGNIYFGGALAANKVVSSGDTFSFAIGALSIQIDS